jgi:hypothetical protein
MDCLKLIPLATIPDPFGIQFTMVPTGSDVQICSQKDQMSLSKLGYRSRWTCARLAANWYITPTEAIANPPYLDDIASDGIGTQIYKTDGTDAHKFFVYLFG